LARKVPAAVILAAMVKRAYTAVFQGVIQVGIFFDFFLSPLDLFLKLAIKLSYVMSEWYELNAHNAQACSFAGNGTVNPLAASTTSAANTAATSCLANFAATFVPTTPAGGSASGTGSGSSTSTSTGAKSGAVNLIANAEALVGMVVVALVSMGSIVWTMA
jgi:hypothetical protein